MLVFIENGNVGTHLGLCFHLAQWRETGLWSQTHLDPNPCSTIYSLWLWTNQLSFLCISFLICKIRIMLSALQVVITTITGSFIQQIFTECLLCTRHCLNIWNARINQSMAIKWDVFEGRTPVVFFCNTKTVITVWKMKDNCKCSVFIFPSQV